MSRKEHPLAGQTVQVKLKAWHHQLPEKFEFVIEDWWINVGGTSWMFADGNPACLIYAMRGGFGGLPTDNEVVYGKAGIIGVLVHSNEIVEQGVAG